MTSSGMMCACLRVWLRPGGGRSIILLLLATALLGHPAESNAQYTAPIRPAFSTLSGGFTRIVVGKSAPDTLVGTFWFFDRSHMFISLVSPIRQNVLLHDKVVLIDYPEMKKGFYLTSDAPPLMPIVPGLVAAMRTDAGIGDLGFKMASYSSSSDSMVSIWTHPLLKKNRATIRLTHVGDRLVRMEVEIPERHHRDLTTFGDFIGVRSHQVPATIRHLSFDPEGTLDEIVKLVGLRADIAVPDSIRNFNFQAGTDVTRKSW